LNSRFRIPDWALLLAFCAFFFFWKISAFGLIGADEPRYAQIAREMLARHDWVTPTLGGAAWLEKPPLYYWQAMAAYAVFGVSDWAARLPSAFDATLLVLAIYFFFRKLRPETAGGAGLMAASTAAIVGYARAASTDMPLAAMFIIAMLAWWTWFESGRRVWLLGFYGFLALATLAKGPVAPVLAGVVVLAFAIVRREGKILVRTLEPSGILVFFAVALPWYVLVQIRNPQFFRVFILQHNLARFGSNVFHHPEPFWYYLPVTLLGWVPWAVFVIAALIWAIRHYRDKDHDPLNTFLVIWIFFVLIFFSFSQSKLPGYVLPAIPAGAVLLANYLYEKRTQRPHIALVCLHVVVAGCLVFAALVLRYAVLQHGIEWSKMMIAPVLVASAFAVLSLVAIIKTGFSGLRFVTLASVVVTMALALRLGAPALDDTLSARSVSEALAHLAPQRLPVAAVLVSRELEFGLQFYRNQKIPRYELGQAPSGEHLVVAREGFRNAFAKNVPGRRIVYLGDFPAQKLEFYYIGP
jgi:4-amino-4-deoxy-L-arabinose transferase-like glycosyltransferase